METRWPGSDCLRFEDFYCKAFEFNVAVKTVTVKFFNMILEILKTSNCGFKKNKQE